MKVHTSNCIYLQIALMVFIAFCSCTEDFLIKEPPGTAAGSVISTPDGVESLSGSVVDWSKPAANYKVEPYPAGHPAFSSKTEARKAVRMETRLEFATEEPQP